MPEKGGQHMPHRIYRSMVAAIRNGSLKEPFNKDDFRKACPGFAEATYGVFLPKHAMGNPGKNSELFERATPGCYKLVRPFKYGL